MNNDYMKVAYLQAKKAYKKDEVPIGAVLILNNEIIAKNYNSVEKHKDCTMHAEIKVIKQAQRKLKNWRLNNCTLYVTLQPCLMCMGAIIQSRIKHIIYSVESNYLSKEEKEYVNFLIKKHNIIMEKGILEEENKNLLDTFFQKKRK